MITRIAAKTIAVFPLAAPTLIINPSPFFALTASITATYVQPIPYIIKNEFIIEGNAAGNKISDIISCDRIPIDFPVSIKSCGTSSKQRTVEGSIYTNVAKKRNEIFIVSSMPNQRISNGENAVTGMYRIADTIGEITSLRGLIAQINSANGTATIIDSKEAIDIRENEYISPDKSCSVRIRPTKADKTAIGDGINRGVVIIDAICHIRTNIDTPKIFFTCFTPRNVV